MSAGELNRRVTIQQQTKVADGYSGFVATWIDVASIWARAWSTSSVESTSDMQTNLIRTQKFKIRFRKLLRASWRIKWGERYFNITAVDPDEKNEFIFLTCKEVV